MKILTTSFLILVVLVNFSCQDTDHEAPKKLYSQSEKPILPHGVSFISLKEKDDHLVVNAVSSLSSRMNGSNSRISSNEITQAALYEYEAGYNSLIFQLEGNDEMVYAQILDGETGKEKDFIVARHDYSNAYKNRNKIVFTSIASDFSHIYYPNPADKLGTRPSSWGSCMNKAIDKLFDDWEAEPVSTFG